MKGITLFFNAFLRQYPYFLRSNFRVFYTRGQNMSISLFIMILNLLIN